MAQATLCEGQRSTVATALPLAGVSEADQVATAWAPALEWET